MEENKQVDDAKHLGLVKKLNILLYIVVYIMIDCSALLYILQNFEGLTILLIIIMIITVILIILSSINYNKLSKQIRKDFDKKTDKALFSSAGLTIGTIIIGGILSIFPLIIWFIPYYFIFMAIPLQVLGLIYYGKKLIDYEFEPSK